VLNGPNGPVTYSYGNGLSQYQSYDGLGRNNGGWVCVTAPSNGCPNQRYGFFLNWSGSRVASSDDDVMGQNNSYGYDQLNRLTSVGYNSGATNFSFSYDRWGNRISQTAPQGGPSTSYTYNTATNQSTSFSYDAVGNLLNDGLYSYQYDAENNLIEIGAGKSAIYTYDAFNRRVRINTQAGAQEFAFNLNGQRVSTWNPSTSTQVQGQFYWGSKPIAFYTAAAGQTFFQHQDWLGTERARTTYNGGGAGVFSSLSFGDNYTVASGTDTDPYHFAGLDLDTPSGTSHAQFRQYSSMQGRWMSPDPYQGSYDLSDPQSMNRYAYVGNSPSSYNDHFGLQRPTNGPPLTFVDGNYINITGANWDEFAVLNATVQYWGYIYKNGQLIPDDPIQLSIGLDYLNMFGSYLSSSATSNINFAQRVTLARSLLTSNCKGKFASTIPGYTTAKFFNTLSGANVGQYPGGTPPQYSDYYGADAFTLPTANTIVLLPNFYGEPVNTQAFILIHEGIHLFGRGSLGDATVQNMFGLPVSSDTDNITQYIAGGCHS